ncbi:cytochrome P450 [Rickenella mellea]|uniref:Cytochrome P450 n=1 Tax=Rickenella mellea TaxID=50990 RepID=A0A4Y7PYE1_9AGAM|nr:cytochrome P450 [Rickenella mellea]
MPLALPQAGAVLLLSVVLWRILRYFLVPSALANIPGPRSQSWWKGNFGQLFDKMGWQFHHDIVEKYGGAVRLHGLFGGDQIYVSDPRALHHILVKDQDIYAKSTSGMAQNAIVFGMGLLSTSGERHRKQRKMMNPVFSMRHMRELLPVLIPITHQLRDVLIRQVQSGKEDVNVMPWMSRAALEYIGQGGLGYSFEALDDTKTNEYSESTKMFATAVFNLVVARQLLPFVMGIPAIIRRKFMEWVPIYALQRARKIVDIMHNTSVRIFNQKKEALGRGEDAVVQQVGKGKDIMSVLLRANTASDESERLPDSEILAQMNTFIQAAFDTATSAICRVLHQLVLYPEVQTKLREEIRQARQEKGDDVLDYDTLMSLPYLDAVTRETLRVFPPLPFSLRTTSQDIVLPLMWPIQSADGKREIKEIPLRKNTTVIIATMAANRSKAIWGADADVWKPERWLESLPKSVSEAHLPGVYASMMTFLGGSRACIGFKFAEMEIKLALSVVLDVFEFAPAPTKEIQWDMRFVQTPTVKGSSDTTPQLPLKITFIKK